MTDTNSVLARWRTIFGGDKFLTLKLARMFSVDRSTTYRWIENGFPDHTMIALEALESTPVEYQPPTLRSSFEQVQSIGN